MLGPRKVRTSRRNVTNARFGRTDIRSPYASAHMRKIREGGHRRKGRVRTAAKRPAGFKSRY